MYVLKSRFGGVVVNSLSARGSRKAILVAHSAAEYRGVPDVPVALRKGLFFRAKIGHPAFDNARWVERWANEEMVYGPDFYDDINKINKAYYYQNNIMEYNKKYILTKEKSTLERIFGLNKAKRHKKRRELEESFKIDSAFERKKFVSDFIPHAGMVRNYHLTEDENGRGLKPSPACDIIWINGRASMRDVMRCASLEIKWDEIYCSICRSYY